MAAIGFRQDVLLRCTGGEKFFLEATEHAASFNTRLGLERKFRLPFLDSQTGVAQNHTDIWHLSRDRQPGKAHGQIYSYPAKRWKKKKHFFLFSELRSAKAPEIETGEAGQRITRSFYRKDNDIHQISTVENPALIGGSEEGSMDYKSESSKDRWYDEYDEYLEPPDAGEMVDDNSDVSDYEETYIKKKKKKGGGRGRKKNTEKEKVHADEDKDKPYACEGCGARYKTRPGLAYHYTHFHNGMMEEEPEPPSPKSSGFPRFREIGKKSRERIGRSEDGKVTANNYCDFCLGDATENKKTNTAEELVSCSDCGRSGHPSCLQFTPNMIISVKKYPWQCIECKSCGLCGTSDNDDQLLFCDDCDRGYHMYCLNPPLNEPPEGNWSCHLCIEEFHGGKKPPGMQ